MHHGRYRRLHRDQGRHASVSEERGGDPGPLRAEKRGCLERPAARISGQNAAPRLSGAGRSGCPRGGVCRKVRGAGRGPLSHEPVHGRDRRVHLYRQALLRHVFREDRLPQVARPVRSRQALPQARGQHHDAGGQVDAARRDHRHHHGGAGSR